MIYRSSFCYYFFFFFLGGGGLGGTRTVSVPVSSHALVHHRFDLFPFLSIPSRSFPFIFTLVCPLSPLFLKTLDNDHQD